MNQLSPLFAFAVLLLAGCKSPVGPGSGAATSAPPVVNLETRTLDTLVVRPGPPPAQAQPAPRAHAPVPGTQGSRYRATPARQHDLIHTRLELSFNWEKEQVLGLASLELSPLFYPTNTLTLDAKNFEIHRLRLVGMPEEPAYEYDGHQLRIQLGRTFERRDTFTVLIDYTASPSESGGSAAITSDKGLFFINPRGENPAKPRQIWTQGETEHNSKWFPTIDQPNERCTQEVLLTVDSQFTTLSNGLLIRSENQPGGTRTDHWVLDQPHAPYLFMLAIGQFAKVEDEWNGIPVEYYVEPPYRDHARAIFAHTPEMLGFFSQKLGLDYPWPKYAQVVVRDYVSGAMENTTAVIFGDFVQQHRLDLIDNGNDNIVAHELFHHWFGDYVTCESWANLTMNEGFANYAEYLWLEHKYGRDQADLHLLSEKQGYFYSVGAGSAHPLIHFEYEDKEDMFDAHSYNKGGAVLHMLRRLVGDEAFFAALQLYLTRHAYRAVEAHDLRLAFEETTGRDLNWFFDQWYFRPGHPRLEVEYRLDTAAGELILEVRQTPSSDQGPAVFRLPSSVDIYFGPDEKENYPIELTQREQTFRFPLRGRPKAVLFDPGQDLLAEVKLDRKPDEERFKLLHSPNAVDRLRAFRFFATADLPAVDTLLAKALGDTTWQLREAACAYFDGNLPTAYRPAIRELARKDPHVNVRQSALETLLNAEEEEGLRSLSQEILERDSAFAVLNLALLALYRSDPEAALRTAKSMEALNSSSILLGIGTVYAGAGDSTQLQFFERNSSRMEGYALISFLGEYAELLTTCTEKQILQGSEWLYQRAIDPASGPFDKYGAMLALDRLRRLESTPLLPGDLPAQLSDLIDQKLQSAIRQETDPRLLDLYRRFN